MIFELSQAISPKILESHGGGAGRTGGAGCCFLAQCLYFAQASIRLVFLPLFTYNLMFHSSWSETVQGSACHDYYGTSRMPSEKV